MPVGSSALLLEKRGRRINSSQSPLCSLASSPFLLPQYVSLSRSSDCEIDVCGHKYDVQRQVSYCTSL